MLFITKNNDKTAFEKENCFSKISDLYKNTQTCKNMDLLQTGTILSEKSNKSTLESDSGLAADIYM